MFARVGSTSLLCGCEGCEIDKENNNEKQYWPILSAVSITIKPNSINFINWGKYLRKYK